MDVDALHSEPGRRSALLGASVFGGRLDESFVVLDSRRGQQGMCMGPDIHLTADSDLELGTLSWGDCLLVVAADVAKQ